MFIVGYSDLPPKVTSWKSLGKHPISASFANFVFMLLAKTLTSDNMIVVTRAQILSKYQGETNDKTVASWKMLEGFLKATSRQFRPNMTDLRFCRRCQRETKGKQVQMVSNHSISLLFAHVDGQTAPTFSKTFASWKLFYFLGAHCTT